RADARPASREGPRGLERAGRDLGRRGLLRAIRLGQRLGRLAPRRRGERQLAVGLLARRTTRDRTVVDRHVAEEGTGQIVELPDAQVGAEHLVEQPRARPRARETFDGVERSTRDARREGHGPAMVRLGRVCLLPNCRARGAARSRGIIGPPKGPRSMRLDRLTRIAGAFAAPLLLCGCPNPNTYTTPRTLDPGKVQWQIAPEAIGVNYNQTVNGTTQSASAILPMVPTFGARVGMVDGFDMGFRLTNLDSASVDGKIRLVKSQFDVALDPGLQGFYVSANGTAAGVLYMHLPVLLGLNLSENVSIVASPGVV